MDRCVYFNQKTSVYLIIYVDDGLVIGRNKRECESIINELSKKFKLKQLSGNSFLGVKIDPFSGISLCQDKYIDEILARFNMADCSGLSTPIVSTAELLQECTSAPTKGPYRAAIGSLQYLACCTRPDIYFAVSFLSRFSHDPEQKHWEAVKRVFRYLKATRHYQIHYNR